MKRITANILQLNKANGISNIEPTPVFDAVEAPALLDPVLPDGAELLEVVARDSVAAEVSVATSVAVPVEIGPAVSSPAWDIGTAF